MRFSQFTLALFAAGVAAQASIFPHMAKRRITIQNVGIAFRELNKPGNLHFVAFQVQDAETGDDDLLQNCENKELAEFPEFPAYVSFLPAVL